MKTLLEIREKIKQFVAKYEVYLFPLVKFALAFAAFMVISSKFGYMSSLKGPAPALLLSLVCSLLPLNATVVFAALLLIAHTYALSIEVCVFTLIVMLLMLLIFFRMAPKYGYLMLLTPLAFLCRIPYLMPLVMGLAAGPVAAVPVACGTFVYYMLHYINQNTAILGTSTDTVTMAEKFTALIDNSINNKEMILMIIALTLTLLVVYAVRRMPFDYSVSVAVAAGVIVELVVMLVGILVMDVSIGLLGVVTGCIISGLAALLLQISVLCLDYSRTERVQFEDDDYYYYVKAVPKVTISMSEKKVKKINARRKQAPAKKVVVRKTSAQGHKKSRARSDD